MASVRKTNEELTTGKKSHKSELARKIWELSLAKNDAAATLKGANGLQGSLSAEHGKKKCLMLYAEAAATILVFSTKTVDTFNLDEF